MLRAIFSPLLMKIVSWSLDFVRLCHGRAPHEVLPMLTVLLARSTRAEPMHSIKHAMDFLHLQRQATSGMRDVPAVVPVDHTYSLHGAAEAVAGLSRGIDAAIPASSSLASGSGCANATISGEHMRPTIDVLQPATHTFDSLDLAEVLSSVMERRSAGDPAWAADLAKQRSVHAIILKLHLKAEADAGEPLQSDAVCDALHVRVFGAGLVCSIEFTCHHLTVAVTTFSRTSVPPELR